MPVAFSRPTAALLAAAGLALAAAPPASARSPVSTQIEAGVRSFSDPGVINFYRNRAHKPLWTANGQVHPATATLVAILDRADLDGMEDGPARARDLRRMLDGLDASRPDQLAKAELALSRAWIDYVQTLRRPVKVGMVYAPGAVSPAAPFPAQILADAAAADDLSAHLRRASDLNPIYKRLRDGLAALDARGPAVLASAGPGRSAKAQIRLNLDRARAIPVTAEGRAIIVDAASATLFMIEDGEVQGSMRVAVGKPEEATPMLSGVLREAVLNPYWNVPPDLVRKRVAAGVLAEGTKFLRAKNYEVLSGWSEDAKVIDPATVDWKAVAAGRAEARVRQLPGRDNAMGEMKFNFPNGMGIYLHDTPDKSIFSAADRRLSSGCVRLEDARRLAAWLFGRTPKPQGGRPEQAVALSTAVPVTITYLTADWDGQRFAFRPDGYGRDQDAGRLALADQTRGGN